MSSNTTTQTLSFLAKGKTAPAGLLTVRILDDEKQDLGLVAVTTWLVARPSILINKVIKDTGAAGADSFEIVSSESMAKPMADLVKLAKAIEKKTDKKDDKKLAKALSKGQIDGHGEDIEVELSAKYGERIVAGSILAGEGKYVNKRTIEIRCLKLLTNEGDGTSTATWAEGEFTGQIRRIATSDLFQVFGSVEDHATKRNADRRARRITAAEAQIITWR